MARNDAYVGSGSLVVQRQVSKSASWAVSLLASRPTLIAWYSFGTRTETSSSAGSEGWSSAGYHQAEDSGSPATVHSSSPLRQGGFSIPSRRSLAGRPPYSTVTAKRRPLAIGVAGVMS